MLNAHIGARRILSLVSIGSKRLTNARCMQLSSVGVIHSKGIGVFGALGHGDSLQDVSTFKRVNVVKHLAGEDENCLDFVQVSAGWGHSAGVTADGRLFVFGRPFDFSNLMQINRIRTVSPVLSRFVGRFTSWFGTPDTYDAGLYTSPVEVGGFGVVESVRCSAGLTVACTAEKNLYAFGLNRWGQCGVDQQVVKLGNTDVSNKLGIHVFVPMLIDQLGPVENYDVGLQHCVAVVDGKVYTWGKGSRGQLGNGEYESGWQAQLIDMEPDLYDDGTIVPAHHVLDATQEKKDIYVVQVSAGFAHTCALTDGGDVYVWGKGLSLTPKDSALEYVVDSEVGRNNGPPMPKTFWGVVVYKNQPFPRRVDLPGGVRAVEIISSNFNIVIRDENNKLWAMGMGEFDRNMIVKPVPVQQAILRQLDAEEDMSASVVMGDSQLRKGYQRVIVLTGDKNNNGQGLAEYECTAVAYEVVVHSGEAFLQEAHEMGASLDEKDKVELGGSEQTSRRHATAEPTPTSTKKRLVDISSGWMHSLAVYA